LSGGDIKKIKIMKIFYQWTKGSYTSIPVYKLAKEYWIPEENILWTEENFTEIWKKIKKEDWAIWILPIENSYAWMVHENLFNFLHFDFKIIWEVEVQVNHCLLSKEKNISDVKTVYSHYQALNQVFNFCTKNNIQREVSIDTAFAAKMVSESDESWIWAIASREAWELFWLNILEEWIQDQDWNRTRMFVVVKKDSDFNLDKKALKNKISILLELKDKPSALYNCLWCFVKNDLNLTKIESMPNPDDPFNYLFCIDFEWKLSDEKVDNMFNELDFFTEDVKILWEY